MKYILVLTFIIIINQVHGQTYKINEASQRINNVKYQGFSSKVDGSYEAVETFWLGYLKQNGKIKRKRNFYQVLDFSIGNFNYDTMQFVTRMSMVDSLGVIWMALDADLDEQSMEAVNKDLSKLLKRATRDFYISVEQKRLDDSEKAAIFISKNHQKMISKGESLTHELEFTEAQKVKLEEQLENAILKIKVLNQQIIDNQEATLKAYNELEKIKSVVEGHKEKLRKIH